MQVSTVSGVRLNTSPAVEAFLFDFGKVATAYEYDWAKQESYARRAAYLSDGGFAGDRAGLADVLERYNRALGAGEAALAGVERLRDPQALAVVTGQQAGIFTGPAYAIYKAMTAIHLARRQEELLGVPVVPVFWIAGEDHDWQEVSWVLAPSGDGTVRIALRESFDGDRHSVGMAPAPESLGEVIDELVGLLPETEFKALVAERIRSAAAAPPALEPAATMGRPTLADWFGRLMAWLFDGTGLIFVCANDPGIRRLEADFFGRAIERFEQVDEAFAAGIARWEGLGYKPTVERQLGSLNLFTYVRGDRLPLVGAGDHVWVRDRAEIGWSRGELLHRAATHPALFSTNVVLRPVIQGAVFPDLAYVGGPGEVAYWGLLRDVFGAMGQQMPVVVPRESYTLVEPPVARILEKQGMSVADGFFRMAEKRQELLEREDRLGIPQLFTQFRAEFGERYEALADVLQNLDSSLKFVTEENRKQIAVQISKLEEKAKQQHRKNCEVGLKQFDRLSAQLSPAGGLQERVVTILPYVAKYGPDLVRRLVDEVAPDETGWSHRAIFL